MALRAYRFHGAPTSRMSAWRLTAVRMGQRLERLIRQFVATNPSSDAHGASSADGANVLVTNGANPRASVAPEPTSTQISMTS